MLRLPVTSIRLGRIPAAPGTYLSRTLEATRAEPVLFTNWYHCRALYPRHCFCTVSAAKRIALNHLRAAKPRKWAWIVTTTLVSLRPNCAKPRSEEAWRIRASLVDSVRVRVSTSSAFRRSSHSCALPRLPLLSPPTRARTRWTISRMSSRNSSGFSSCSPSSPAAAPGTSPDPSPRLSRRLSLRALADIAYELSRRIVEDGCFCRGRTSLEAARRASMTSGVSNSWCAASTSSGWISIWPSLESRTRAEDASGRWACLWRNFSLTLFCLVSRETICMVFLSSLPPSTSRSFTSAMDLNFP
mmetsp:Transcript_45129/g.143713  ORF Transcript_45129/g.143713 Transcript_45129/m.143713 type:complete len:301 (-) Transcript_45129:932-1834(-)